MTEKQPFKQVKIKDGKFTLEGKIVWGEVLELFVIQSRHHLTHLNTFPEESYPESHREDERKWYERMKEEDLKEINMCAPNEANAYIIGESQPIVPTKTLTGVFYNFCPILYLKIKEKDKNE